jgi:hypothetical protein
VIVVVVVGASGEWGVREQEDVVWSSRLVPCRVRSARGRTRVLGLACVLCLMDQLFSGSVNTVMRCA